MRALALTLDIRGAPGVLNLSRGFKGENAFPFSVLPVASAAFGQWGRGPAVRESWLPRPPLRVYGSGAADPRRRVRDRLASGRWRKRRHHALPGFRFSNVGTASAFVPCGSVGFRLSPGIGGGASGSVGLRRAGREKGGNRALCAFFTKKISPEKLRKTGGLAAFRNFQFLTRFSGVFRNFSRIKTAFSRRFSALLRFSEILWERAEIFFTYPRSFSDAQADFFPGKIFFFHGFRNFSSVI